MDSHQGAVLLRQAAELLLQAGDLDGDFFIFHQLGQQFTPEEKFIQQMRSYYKSVEIFQKCALILVLNLYFFLSFITLFIYLFTPLFLPTFECI